MHTSIRISKKIDFKSILFLLIVPFLFPSCFSSKKTTRKKGINVEEIRLRSNITKYAEKQIGTKYKYGGESPRAGFDCSGFTVYVMLENGIGLNRTSRSQANMGRKISLNRAQAGDLVFFSRRGKINHVALVAEHTEEGIFIIHSTSSRGVIKENLSISTYWKPKIKMVRDVISNL